MLDEEGRLLENPVHYRDNRTNGMLAESFAKIDKDTFYQITGNQFMEINTAFQLLSLAKNRQELLKRADKMLLMPDLFNYFPTGEKKSRVFHRVHYAIIDAKARNWSEEVDQSPGTSGSYFPTDRSYRYEDRGIDRRNL